MTLQEISQNIKTQDNLATSLPMFVVQKRRRIYGMDSGYIDEAVWYHCDGDEASDDEAAALDEQEKGGDEIDDCWTKMWYIDAWEMATVTFTRKGAEDYIAANGHNLTDPRIYVESGWRNSEWETVRNHLMELTK